MREKHYVRRGGEVCGVQYTPPGRGKVGAVMICGNIAAEDSAGHIQDVVNVLYADWGKVPTLDAMQQRGNGYKHRLFVDHVGVDSWTMFKVRLRQRGFTLTSTRRFGRLAR